METKKANLFIVGAMRAGTTSFVELLSKHPQIYVSPIKEPNYFVDRLPLTLYEPSRFFNLNRYLNSKFPDPLHIAKIETLTQYEQLFSLATHEVYRVDASTAYLHAPEAAANIATYNSEAKVIVILRDPLDRAYSHYRMDLGLGRIKSSFEECMLEQLDLYNRGELPWDSYLNMSCYDKSIEHYSKLFGKVICIHFEDLLSDFKGVFSNIIKELNVSPFENMMLKKNNSSQTPRFKLLWYWGKRWGLKDTFSYLVSSKVKRGIFQNFSRTDNGSPEISENLCKAIDEIFRIHSLNYYKSAK